MSKREETDIIEQLLDVADGIATMSEVDRATLLRRAALDIGALRNLIGVREELAGDNRAA